MCRSEGSEVLAAPERRTPALETNWLLHAPPELVWHAVTQERHRVRWLPDGGATRVARIAPAAQAVPPGDRAQSVPGGDHFQILRLRETADGCTVLRVSVAFGSEVERDEALGMGVSDVIEDRLRSLADYLASLGWGPEDDF